MKILIFGLPGSGKTTLAKELAYHFCIPHHNADYYRMLHDDWDFSPDGRLRQAMRMKGKNGILDFVAPKQEYRDIVQPTVSIYMDTIKESRYDDTNKLFEVPHYLDIDYTVKTWIDIKKLRKCLVDFNPGIKGIQSFLKEQFPKLVR